MSDDTQTIEQEAPAQVEETSEFNPLADTSADDDKLDLARFYELSVYNNFQDYTESEKQELREVRLALREYLPLSFDKLDLGVIKIMTSSISLLNSTYLLEDYTCFLFPALKAIEAIILQIISGLHITFERRFRLGWLFYDRNANNPEELSHYVLSPSCRYYDMIPLAYHASLEGLYNLFNRYRHYYFHANRNIDGEISYISTQAYAIDLLMTIYAEIEKSAVVL